MRDNTLYERAGIQDDRFPIQLIKNETTHAGLVFQSHWHEQLEILYFTKGTGVIACSSTSYEVKANDLIIINSNELHSGYNPGNPLAYYCFNIDPSLIHSSFADACEMKYIGPIERNMILFKNKTADHELIECMQTVINEYEHKDTAFELIIKSSVYKLLALLIRNNVSKVVSQQEHERNTYNLERMSSVLKYIEKNYTEKIRTEDLCAMAGLSTFYFCRLFKKITGKTANEYINALRINKAESLLKSSHLNITEIAMQTGFDDMNYFSRLFKRHKKVAPSKMRKATPPAL